MTEVINTLTYGVADISYETFKYCPEDYQKYVIRILAMQAYAERAGANEVATHLKLAPDFRARKGLAKIVSDEATHAYWLYEILEKIGVSEEEAIAIAEGKNDPSKRTVSLDGVIAVGDESNEWIDLILNNMLMDRAGSYMVENFSQSSFAPWAGVCVKIYADEQWHKSFGLHEFKLYLQKYGAKQISKNFTDWYIRALNFFGPSTSKSEIPLKNYGIKRQSNDELRTKFVIEVEKIIAAMAIEDLVLGNISDSYPYAVKTSAGAR